MIPEFKQAKRESNSVQGPVVGYARRQGLVAVKMSGPGHRSFPDYIFFGKHGLTFLIEFKAPGKPLTTNQEKAVISLRQRGHVVFVVDDKTEGEACVDSML